MSNKKDSLGDRMKEFYENVPKTKLTRRVPVIIRVDGKAFHTFTRGMAKPFDPILMRAMQETTRDLCANIQGCKLGYVQSDEISLLLTDYDTIKTDAWFGYEVEKMCSIAGSMATLYFNKNFTRLAKEVSWNLNEAWNISEADKKYDKVLINAIEKGALFDARVFNIPKEEVTNCFIWRQQDATRNSIESVGQANFSQNQLHGKNCDQIQEMLWQEKGINWNDFSIPEKRGTCVRKVEKVLTNNVTRNVWEIDKNIPIFTQDRDYIDKLI